MPIYEYQCSVCGHHLETIQKMSEAPLVDCPACGRPGLRKLVSAAGFQLKGSGWYVTDFKSKAPSAAPAAPSGTAAASDSAATPPGGGSEGGAQEPAKGASGKKADQPPT